MVKYEFVSLKLKNNPVKDALLQEHRQIIREYAEKGFIFSGFIPTKFGPSGKTVEMDLVFETEV